MQHLIDDRTRRAYQAGLNRRDLPPELIDAHFKIWRFVDRIPEELRMNNDSKVFAALVCLSSGCHMDTGQPRDLVRPGDMRPRPVTRAEAQQQALEDEEAGIPAVQPNGRKNTAFDYPLEPLEEAEEAQADGAEMRQQAESSMQHEPLPQKTAVAEKPLSGQLTVAEWQRVPVGSPIKVTVNGKQYKGKYQGFAGENRLVVTYFGYPRPVHAPPDRVLLDA